MILSKERFVLLLILGSLLVLGACTPVASPVTGAFYTNVKHGTNVGDGQLDALRSGEACATAILGLVALGDASIEAARKNGGITKIAFVDHRSKNIWFFYAEFCTIVWGE